MKTRQTTSAALDRASDDCELFDGQDCQEQQVITVLRDALERERTERMRMLAELKDAVFEAGRTGKDRDILSQRVDGLQQTRDQLASNIARLENEQAALRHQLTAAHQSIATITNSAAWRITAPLRKTGTAIPAPARRILRRVAKLSYWILTPWALPRRLRLLRSRVRQPPSPIASPQPTVVAAEAPVSAPIFTDALIQRFTALAPLGVFRVLDAAPRITMITDSVNAGSLFGGVGTAIALATLIAQRRGALLRLVTRTEPPNPDNFEMVLAANRIDWRKDVQFEFAPVGGSADIAIGNDEIFLTTSWWTTRAVRPVIDPRRIIYLLQEDERMFYPYGDDRLRCAETLSDPEINYVINSELLFEHLRNGAEPLQNIGARGIPFEPAFPAFSDEAKAPLARDGRRNFFFYARPRNLRNLYWRGLEAIAGAIEEGTLAPVDWNFYFAGRDLGEIRLPRNASPIIRENLSWIEYANLVRQIDVGLALMDTPHPSYPPLDLAAGGAVVVTNRHGVKTSLERYCRNILCVEPKLETLRDGIAEAVDLASNAELRALNFAGARICRDWQTSFAPVLMRLFPNS